jgi:tripartite motif-containing protein 71
MPVFRPSRSDINLSNFWNALNRNAPAEELSRLAQLVEPSELAAIHRARELHAWQLPDLAFANRLERTIMNATVRPTAQVIPLPRAHVRPRPRPRYSLPQLKPWLGSRRVQAISFALTAVLVLATLAGIWFATERNGNNNLLGPASATPTTEVSPDVPIYRGNPARTGVFPGPDLEGAPIDLWTLQTGEPVNLGAAVVDGVLYLPAGSQGFEARDAITGDLRWAFPTDAPAVSAPAVVDGLGYVIDAASTLYAVHTDDGTEAWRMDSFFVNSSVAPVDGLVYAASPEGTLYALEAATGAIAWQADIGADTRGGMAVADGIVYQGNGAGVMSAFDAKTGEPRWTFQNEEGAGGATVTVANGQLYFTIGGDANAAMYAVDAATGELTWRQEQGPDQGFVSTTATPTRLYSVAVDGKLHALDAATGETVWTYQLIEFVRSIPVLVDDTLYVADNGGFVRAIDAETGQQRWEYPIAGEVDLGWPVVSNGVLYIGTSFGNFYAITGSEMIAAQSIRTPTPAATPAGGGLPSIPTALTTTFLWQAGGADSALAQPDGIATAPDGSIWVVDAVDHEVHVFEADGTTRQVIALNDAGAGAFSFTLPNGEGYASISVDADGNAWVLDTGHFRVVKFDANGQFVQEMSYQDQTGNTPYSSDIVVGPDGSVYVEDGRTPSVLRFTANGELAAVIGQPEKVDERLTGPARIGVDAEGNVYVTDNGSGFAEIKVYAPDGTFLRRFGDGDLELAIDVTVDANGIAYVTDPPANQIKIFDGSGALIGAIGEAGTEPGQFTGIDTVAVDGNGNLYVLDFEGRQVEAFHLTWTSPADAAASDQVTLLWDTPGGEGGLSGSSTLTIAPDGNIWVADADNARFQIFDSDGTFIESWTGSGDGQFGLVQLDDGDPYGAVAFAPDGSFYVLDPGARRILVFSADRTFLRSFGERGRDPGQFVQPIAIVTDPTGNVAVLDDARGDVQVFSPDGTLMATPQLETAYTAPLSANLMAIDGDGNIFVAEAYDNPSFAPVVEKFDPDGNLLQQFGDASGPGSFGRGMEGEYNDQPSGVAVDATGNVYVTEIGANPRIVVFSPEGDFLMEFGGKDSSTVTFDLPLDIALDDQGNLYVTDLVQNRLVKLSLPESLTPAPAPDEVTLLWETTGGDGGLESAGTVALAPDGTIWVADTIDHGFLIFDADGAFLESWTGTGDGEFTFMRANGDRFNAIAFAPDGSYYVLDPGNFRIQAFAADRTFLRSIGGFGQEPGQFLRPIDVTIDPTGNLAVLDDKRWDVQTFAPDGTLVATIPLQSTGAGAYEMNSMTIDPDGNFYVAELSEELPKQRIVEKFDPDGNLVQQFGQAPGPGTLVDHPGRIAVDVAGNVYVTENEANPRILVFTPEGEYLTEFGGPESPVVAFEGLSGLALDGKGNVYLADGFQNRLVKLRLPQSLIPAAADQVTLLWETAGGPTPLSKTSSVRVAPDGNIWVADGAHSQFQIFAPDGTFIEAWGTPGSGDGQFNFVRPNSDGDSFGAVAFAPDGSFYVADMGNHRIQHFASDRSFLHAWGSFGGEDGQFISPIDIAVDSQGNVFVDDDKREDIQKFAADGTFLLKFGGPGQGPGQLNFQGWMSIDGEDNVWVADSANGRVQAWANDGTFLTELGLAGTVGDPSNLAFDESGRLYVLDNKDKRVVVFDSSYAVIASWDLATTGGTPPETVIGLALDGDGNMYVTDYLGSVLLKYQLAPIPDATPTAP